MLDAPEISFVWEEAASLLLHKSVHFFKVQFSLLQQAFSKSMVVYLRTMRSLNRVLARQSQNPHVLARDRGAVMYAWIDLSWP